MLFMGEYRRSGKPRQGSGQITNSVIVKPELPQGLYLRSPLPCYRYANSPTYAAGLEESKIVLGFQMLQEPLLSYAEIKQKSFYDY